MSTHDPASAPSTGSPAITPSSRRLVPLKELVGAAIVGALFTSAFVWLNRAYHDWGTPDWVSNISQILLFIIAYFLGRRQGLLVEIMHALTLEARNVLANLAALNGEVRALQRGIAELQICEKVGVIYQRAEEMKTQSACANTLTNDAASVLPVFEFADSDQRCDYEGALDTALTDLGGRTDRFGRYFRVRLAEDIARKMWWLRDRHKLALALSLERILQGQVVAARSNNQEDIAAKLDELLTTRPPPQLRRKQDFEGDGNHP